MTSAWLDRRRQGLTATDAAAILGLSKWKGALEVWADKTGALPPDPWITEPWQEWGNILEPVVKAQFHLKTGRERIDLCRAAIGATIEALSHDDGTTREMAVSNSKPWLMATPDFAVESWSIISPELGGPEEQEELEGFGVGEAKTCSAWTAKDWADGVPIYYQAQVQHQLAVMGLQWASVPVLFGGNDFRVYDLPRWERMAEFIQVLERFWRENVQADIPPEVDHLKSTRKALGLMSGPPEGALLLPESMDALDEKREALAVKRREVNKAWDSMNNQILQALGKAEEGEVPGSGVILRRGGRAGTTIYRRAGSEEGKRQDAKDKEPKSKARRRTL